MFSLILQHVKRYPECQVSHNIKAEEIEYLRDIYLFSYLAGDDVIQLVNVDQFSLFEFLESWVER